MEGKLIDMATFLDITHSAYVTRRARGVWLAQWYDYSDGVEEFDAFPTERQAKAWAADQLDEPRLQWERVDGAIEMYRAEIVKKEED